MGEGKRKLFGTIVGVIVFILCLLSLTFAYYVWKSANTNVDVGIHDGGLKYVYKKSASIEGANLSPILDYTDSSYYADSNYGKYLIYSDYTATNTKSDTYMMYAKINIISMSDALKSTGFKWVLLEKVGDSYSKVLKSGNFSNLSVGSNTIYSDIYIEPEEIKEYRFIVYIDGNSSDSSNMQNASIKANLELCDQAVPIYPITLNNQGADSNKGGTSMIYEKYGMGIYKDSTAKNDLMTTSSNGITNPTRTGYTFLGYYTASNGGGVNLIGTNSYITSNFTNKYFNKASTLYAKWSINKYNLTINPNGGTYNNSTSTVNVSQNYNTTYGLLPATRTGYTFNKWNLSGSGTLMRGNASAVSISKSTEITRTVKTDTDGTSYTNYAFNLNNSGSSNFYPFIRFNNYAYTSGHKYRITYMMRVRKSSGFAYAHVRHSAFNNDWGSSGWTFKNVGVTDGWVEYSMERTFTGTTLTLSGNSYNINPCVEIYFGIAPGTTGEVDMDMKNLSVYDVTANTYISNENYGGYVYRFGAGNGTLTGNWNVNTYNINYTLNNGTKGTNTPSSGNYDSNITIDNPTKTIKATGDANGTGATIGLATSKAQTFNGWTASNINTSTAKYGDSTSSITNSWSNGSTLVKSKYFKNLNPTNGSTVTLTANWTPVAFNLPTVSKTGYTCNWNTKSDGSGTSYASGASYTPTAVQGNVTLYARCSANDYTIIYNANGGTGTMDSQTVKYDSTATIKNNAFTKRGYAFVGWSTSSSTKALLNDTSEISGSKASGESGYSDFKQYTINAPFSSGEKYRLEVDVKGSGNLYNYFYGASNYLKVASWTSSTGGNGTNADGFNSIPLSSNYTHYTVTFTLGSSGDGNVNKYVLFRAMPGCSATIKNVKFYKLNASENTYVGGASVKNLATQGNVNLYAIWKANSYTISYNANDGSGTMSSHTVNYDDNTTIKTNTFTRTGYTFAGWTTKSDGTSDGYNWTGWSGKWAYIDGQYGISNGKLVLYAMWTVNKYNITYDQNYYSDNLWNDSFYPAKYSCAATCPSAKSNVDEDAARSGNVVKFTMNAGTSGGVYYAPNSKLTAGKTYTWSVYVKASSNKTLKIGDEQGGQVNVNVTTSWQRVTHTFVANDNSYYAFVFYLNGSSWNASDELYVHSLDIREGSQPVTTSSLTYGSTLGDSLKTLTRTGYTFDGWYTAPVGGTKVTSTTTVSNANATYYAHWTANKVYLDLNLYLDGTGINSSTATSNGISVGFRVNNVDKGYVTDYWTQNYYGVPYQIYGVKVDGTNISNYTKSGTVGASNTEVSAEFYNLNIKSNNTNYGTVSASKYIVPKGGTYTTSSNKLTLNDSRSVTATAKSITGYTTSFSSWSSASGTVNAASTITANFASTINSYNVNYDCTTNGGSGTIASVKVNYNASVDLTKTCTPKTGYTLVGWNTNKSATSKLDSLKMGTSNITLYAIYKKNVAATFYYYNSGIKNVSSSCDLYNNNTSCSATVPLSTFKDTTSQYGSVYVGYGNINTMNISTNSTVTLSGAKNYYVAYRKSITEYSSGTSRTVYRNAFFTSNNAMNTVLSTSSTGTSNLSNGNWTNNSVTWTFAGYATSNNTANKSYNSVAAAATSTATSLYSLYTRSVAATFYYYNGSAQATVSASGTQTANYSGSVVGQGAISIPNAVSSSKGPNNSTYKGISTSVSSTTVTSTVNTSQIKYYAIYNGTNTATFTKENSNVSSIGSTSLSCNINSTTNGSSYRTTSCSITLPTITPASGYIVAGWYNSGGTLVGNAGNSLNLTSNATYTAKAKRLKAEDFSYDNSKTGVDCDDVQCAIDKLDTRFKTLKLDYNFKNNNMNNWQKTYSSRFNISYNSSSDMNTIAVSGDAMWENIYLPIDTVQGVEYTISFDYENPNGYTALSGIDGVSGIMYQITNKVEDDTNIANSVVNETIPTSATSSVVTKTLKFTGTGSTMYFNFNFGGAMDGVTTTLKIGDIKISSEISKEIGSSVGSLSSPSMPGAKFLGWYTEASGGNEIKSTSTVTSSVSTYYAHWLNLGDYVSMTPTKSSYTTDTSKTGYSSTQTINPQELNLWRVISLNSDGTVDVISEHVSSTSIYFNGQVGYQNFVGYLNVLASQYENSTYTKGSRYFGYNGQTEYITDTSKISKRGVPWTCSTDKDGCTVESQGGGDTLYKKDYDLVNSTLKTLEASTVASSDSVSYWVSSRLYIFKTDIPPMWDVGGRIISKDSINVDMLMGLVNGTFHSVGRSNYLRPIVTLKSGLKYTGSGTAEDPYKLSAN